ncbi:MAG: methionine--tRNA ligase [bacterium]|nr:methionine--tRNA ligase [bacterium]
MKNKILITTPIYYVNDKPHWGHAYTTVAADVLTRFFRIQGNEVFFLTGTDEHGAKVAESAEKLGKNPKVLCDDNSEAYKIAWEKLGIEYDYFIRTTDKIHEEKVVEFLKELKDKNAVYEKEYEGLYCVGCEKFLTEKDLVDGKCPDHKTEPKKIAEKNYFFKLTNYLGKIEKLISKDQLLIQPEIAKKEVLGLFKQRLEDFSISRQKEKVRWGIDLPFGENQTVYVWVDALLNYCTGNGTKEFDTYWEKGKVIHVLGKDILKFHAIFWPAMLLAAGKNIPQREFIHGFFTFNGQKMSKTIGNVIDPSEIVDKFGVDATRYLLLSQFPFGQDGDVKKEKFVEKYNSDLANGLGNLVARVLTLANKYGIKDGKSEKEIEKRIKGVKEVYEKDMQDFRLFEALEEIWKLIGFCDKYIEENKPWQITDKKKLETVLSNLLYCISEIADLIAPFLPETSEKIKNQLKTGKSEILFPRLQ